MEKIKPTLLELTIEQLKTSIGTCSENPNQQQKAEAKIEQMAKEIVDKYQGHRQQLGLQPID